MMKRDKKEPLYRKVNTKTHNVHHHYGGDYKNKRRADLAESPSMSRGVKRGLDYTPLFRFLLSKVGQSWDAVHSEAVSRLDKQEPISWIVSPHKDGGKDIVRVDESSYFSGLYVDDEGVLQIVEPETGPGDLEPNCACCTHTLNGTPFTKKYKCDC